MDMPGRNVTPIDNYKFSFNGKLDDKGDGWQTQDYGYRIYDYRLGRFLSEDPLREDFAYLTPYQFASNSPISNIDLDGLEAIRPEGMAQTPEGGPYGQRGQDWDVVTMPPGEVDIARKNGWIGPEGKYYYDYDVFKGSASYGGAVIWQKKVKVLTCKTIKSKVGTVRNIVVMNKVKQKPLNKKIQTFSSMQETDIWDYDTEQIEQILEFNIINTRNVKAKIDKEQGVIDEVELTAGTDYNVEDFNRMESAIKVMFPGVTLTKTYLSKGQYVRNPDNKKTMLFGLDIKYHINRKEKTETTIEQQVETNDCEETDCQEETKQ